MVLTFLIFSKDFERFIRLIGSVSTPDRFKLDWLIEATHAKIKKLV